MQVGMMEEIEILHARAVKAYGVAVTATPGTETAKKKWKAYELAEARFRNALYPINKRWITFICGNVRQPQD